MTHEAPKTVWSKAKSSILHHQGLSRRVYMGAQEDYEAEENKKMMVQKQKAAAALY